MFSISLRYLKTQIYFRFGVWKSVLQVIYPNFLYPVGSIALTSSIYMIMAITYERYCAVHYHVNYRMVSEGIL